MTTDELAALILSLTQAEADEVPRRTLETLAAVRSSPDGVTLLISALSDSNRRVRVVAMALLAQFRDEPHARAALDALAAGEYLRFLAPHPTQTGEHKTTVRLSVYDLGLIDALSGATGLERSADILRYALTFAALLAGQGADHA